jgi:2-polyprenyl-6-methoxyphenol hydroxylase-like FAD-dependent oxidoreductase
LKIENTDILLVGLGPVGLFMTFLLAKSGLRVLAVEKRASPSNISRSIGIHPPILDLFEDLGILKDFLDVGVKIKRTHVFKDKNKIQTVNLELLDSKNKFVLSIPQYETERILEEKIALYQNSRIIRNLELNLLSQSQSSVTSEFKDGTKINSKYLIACDGHKSTVRNLLNISFIGRNYNDFYAMADFSNEDKEMNSAIIGLGQEGLLEIFPLSPKTKRWVVRLKKNEEVDLSKLKEIINKRKPESLILGQNLTQVTTFAARNYIAKSFYDNRVVLLGDSAHVVSPIGGQGMNLGWIGAINLLSLVNNFQDINSSHTNAFSLYEKNQKELESIVSKRANLNMSFGRPSFFLSIKILMLKLLLNSIFSKQVVKQFTMGGLLK